MRQFEIVPGAGVGPIKIGMTKAEVHGVFGLPEFESGNRFGYLGGFFIDFDDRGQVEFIELAQSEIFAATYLGHDLHRIEAESAIGFVAAHAALDNNHPEPGYSYIFPELQMSLWRSVKPDDDSDLDGRHFEAIGIGCDEYFSSTK